MDFQKKIKARNSIDTFSVMTYCDDILSKDSTLEDVLTDGDTLD